MSNHLKGINALIENLNKSLVENERIFADTINKLEDKNLAMDLQEDLKKMRVKGMDSDGFQAGLSDIINKINKATNDSK